MKTSLALAALLVVGVSGAASAQSAAQNFTYKAPSGMFGEGTTKWQMYQFMETDQSRLHGDLATGSVSTSSSNDQSYPRPGERTASPRRPTAR